MKAMNETMPFHYIQDTRHTRQSASLLARLLDSAKKYHSTWRAWGGGLAIRMQSCISMQCDDRDAESRLKLRLTQLLWNLR